MTRYEIISDYDNGFRSERNLIEVYYGDWTDLQAYIEEMREHGFYNIVAVDTLQDEVF